MTLESILAFLSRVGRMTFWGLAILAFVFLAGWVTLRILRGETVLPVGSCLNVIVRYGLVLLLGASLGAYLGEQIQGAIIDTIWVKAFFAVAGAGIAVVAFTNFNQRKK